VLEEAKQTIDFTLEERAAYFNRFQTDVSSIQLPSLFTFPFYYDPHPLCLQAIEELKPIINQIPTSVYDFGLDSNSKQGIGKMFGVLVVQNEQDELGYIVAFSGKLGPYSHQHPFVPPVFNRLAESGYFKQVEANINKMNASIQLIEASEELANAQKELEDAKAIFGKQVSEAKAELKRLKKERKQRRAEAALTLNEIEFAKFKEELASESINQQLWLKHMQHNWHEPVIEKENQLKSLTNQIDDLKEQRKTTSANLQAWLFNQYQFKNGDDKTKGLQQIFTDFGTYIPRAGAGECAAPKLMQFAYISGWKPICMAEFWWGRSPSTEIRKHLHFYPACRTKCEPILGWMLQGLDVEPNPILEADSDHLSLEIIHEDEAIIVVNKPSGLLSVPGKKLIDSVAERIQMQYPDITGPVIVHRLDMSTSGLMVVARNQQAHKFLQHQFIERTTSKRYVAILDGELSSKEGNVDLPLRVDLDNRPMQMVCYEHGKTAKTKWELIETVDGKSRVYFYPITGRTHQLRMHASHPSGLNMPIVGDDLYGLKSDRLHLHAERLSFAHPTSKERVEFHAPAPF